MARTPEGKVKDEICRGLKALGIPHWRFSPGPYMPSGLPDILAVLNRGRVLWLEVKAPDAKPRRDGSEELQRRRIAEVHARGGIAGFVRSWADVCGLMMLKQVRPINARSGLHDRHKDEHR